MGTDVKGRWRRAPTQGMEDSCSVCSERSSRRSSSTRSTGRWWCRFARVRRSEIAARTAGGAARAMTTARAAGGGGRWISATTFCFLEADAPRVSCRRHGVVVAAVPWARHDAGFTRSFEDQVAWLAVNTSARPRSRELMRIAWRTVGWICERVTAEAQAQRDLFAGLKRLGFDEISVRKGQRYLTVVVDHDTGRLVWAHPGRDRKTVEKFLDLLGKDRCEQITAGVLRHGRLDHRSGRRALPERRASAWTRSTSSSSPPTRWTRSAARSGTTPAAPATRSSPRSSRAPASRSGRTPRTSPSASSQKLARVQQTQQAPLPRLPALPAAARDLPRPARAGARAARRVAEVGTTLPARAVRQARQDDHRTALQGSRQRSRQQLVERPSRASEHPDPADHPPRVRLPLTLGRHRPRDALTRRPLPTTTRPVTPPTDPAGGSFLPRCSTRCNCGRCRE